MCESFFMWKIIKKHPTIIEFESLTSLNSSLTFHWKQKSHMVRIICVENYNQMSTARTIIRMAKIKTTITFLRLLTCDYYTNGVRELIC